MDVATLYAAHAPGLHRFLVRFTGDPDLAADALQEAFVRLMDRRPEARELRAWLYTVALNHVRTRHRTRARQLRLLATAPAGAAYGDAPPDPTARVLGRERHARVQDALLTLSARDRTVLLMREAGFAQHEIADAVGTTTKSVGTITARALAKLARALGPLLEELR